VSTVLLPLAPSDPAQHTATVHIVHLEYTRIGCGLLHVGSVMEEESCVINDRISGVVILIATACCKYNLVTL
jgi:hypothetical protein